jgi:alpha-L-fucosidase
MKRRAFWKSLAAAGVVGLARPLGAAVQTEQSESAAGSMDRLRWFREAKFGMFIHWGLYAIPARGEWVQFHRGISGPEYEKYAARFNPTKFNAREWVALAKEAGQKYMVLTTKHHDGFCMWDSKLTDYTIVKASPFGRDPLKELAEECSRQGVTLGVYYSVKDWHHPQYPTLYTRREKKHPDGFHGFPNPKADFMKYLDYMQGQLRELMTGYGPIGTLFFDWYGDAFEIEQERRRAQEIVDMVHELQPTCAINNRLAGIGADYGTPEQQIPESGGETAFEVCMTIGRSWGYSRNDKFKDGKTIVVNLSDIAGKVAITY